MLRSLHVKGFKSLADARLKYQWLDPTRTSVKNKADGTVEWWTFAGV